MRAPISQSRSPRGPSAKAQSRSARSFSKVPQRRSCHHRITPEEKQLVASSNLPSRFSSENYTAPSKTGRTAHSVPANVGT